VHLHNPRQFGSWMSVPWLCTGVRGPERGRLPKHIESQAISSQLLAAWKMANLRIRKPMWLLCDDGYVTFVLNARRPAGRPKAPFCCQAKQTWPRLVFRTRQQQERPWCSPRPWPVRRPQTSYWRHTQSWHICVCVSFCRSEDRHGSHTTRLVISVRH
jgi:hypothetical protein